MDYMLEAIKEARLAYEKEETPIGAIIVKDDVIIGRGGNYTEKGNDPINHAEIMAIRDAVNTIGDWRLFDSTMYVTMEPCPMCTGAIINAKLKKVVVGAYHTKNAKVDKELELSKELLRLNRIELEYDLRDECGEILTSFFKGLRDRAKALAESTNSQQDDSTQDDSMQENSTKEDSMQDDSN